MSNQTSYLVQITPADVENPKGRYALLFTLLSHMGQLGSQPRSDGLNTRLLQLDDAQAIDFVDQLIDAFPETIELRKTGIASLRLRHFENLAGFELTVNFRDKFHSCTFFIHAGLETVAKMFMKVATVKTYRPSLGLYRLVGQMRLRVHFPPYSKTFEKANP